MLDKIRIKGYKSIRELELKLKPINILIGSNGVGKTNIVEAIDYAASLSSHRVSHDGPLVRMGASRAYIRTRTVRVCITIRCKTLLNVYFTMD